MALGLSCTILLSNLGAQDTCVVQIHWPSDKANRIGNNWLKTSEGEFHTPMLLFFVYLFLRLICS